MVSCLLLALGVSAQASKRIISLCGAGRCLAAQQTLPEGDVGSDADAATGHNVWHFVPWAFNMLLPERTTTAGLLECCCGNPLERVCGLCLQQILVKSCT
jgi:hypothetical protein